MKVENPCFISSIEYNNMYIDAEGINMSFILNLNGQLQSFNLPEYKSLWPLFETIVNSIQSIEDSENKNNGKIIITANRNSMSQGNLDGSENDVPFEGFVVKDNGDGFNSKNYQSFREAYSTLKIAKGCKGIGRFLWLKSFKNVRVVSTFNEDSRWLKRKFNFNPVDEIVPENNNTVPVPSEEAQYSTIVSLERIIKKYGKNLPVSLDVLAKKIIEHCLPYFLGSNCPKMILRDNDGEEIDINNLYDNTIKESLHRDEIMVKGRTFILYHIRMYEGVTNHELHFCANSREVKSFELKKFISNLQKRLCDKDEGKTFFYQGYLIGEYLNDNVNLNRTAFNFESEPEHGLYDEQYITENDLIGASQNFIETYLHDALIDVKEKKIQFINTFVKEKKPQYRYLLSQKPDLYESIPANINECKLELELHKGLQKWEIEISEQAKEIEDKVKKGEFNQEEFNKIFNQYCLSVTGISKSSLAEYVIRRKSILDLLEKALEQKEDGSYYSEATVHSIICPMKYTSNDIQFEEMNLWIIDDRLSYHSFLASDKMMKSLPVINVDSEKRMDIAIFNQAISFSESKDVLNSISIIEFKKPNRDNLKDDDKNPINQVLGYVKNIREGKVKKANGRPFGNVSNTAFYCYVIVDLTESVRLDAENASLTESADGEGYFGYNKPRDAYIEVISYSKLLRDAKQRNQILFDKLFSPNIMKTLNGKLLDEM